MTDTKAETKTETSLSQTETMSAAERKEWDTLESIRESRRIASRKYRKEHGDPYSKIYAQNTGYTAQKNYYQRNKERICAKLRKKYHAEKENEK